MVREKSMHIVKISTKKKTVNMPDANPKAEKYSDRMKNAL